MKKIKLVSTLLLSAILLFPALANADSNSVEDAVQKESIRIADSYSIGEKLSEDDLKFIINHANKVENTQNKSKESKASIQALNSDNWNIYGMARTSGGLVEGQISGDVTVDVGFVSVSVVGDLKAEKIRGSVTAAKVNFRFLAYGIVSTESPYVGKVADWSQSGTGKESASVHISKTTYAAVSVYELFPEGSLTYANGTLNLTGTPKKQ